MRTHVSTAAPTTPSRRAAITNPCTVSSIEFTSDRNFEVARFIAVTGFGFDPEFEEVGVDPPQPTNQNTQIRRAANS